MPGALGGELPDLESFADEVGGDAKRELVGGGVELAVLSKNSASGASWMRVRALE